MEHIRLPWSTLPQGTLCLLVFLSFVITSNISMLIVRFHDDFMVLAKENVKYTN